MHRAEELPGGRRLGVAEPLDEAAAAAQPVERCTRRRRRMRRCVCCTHSGGTSTGSDSAAGTGAAACLGVSMPPRRRMPKRRPTPHRRPPAACPAGCACRRVGAAACPPTRPAPALRLRPVSHLGPSPRWPFPLRPARKRPIHLNLSRSCGAARSRVAPHRAQTDYPTGAHRSACLERRSIPRLEQHGDRGLPAIIRPMPAVRSALCHVARCMPCAARHAVKSVTL
jgi:hypothetical protein